MRPTPADIIAGARRILGEVVEPEVRSDYARARLREVRAVLGQLDWDNVALTLAEHATGLASVLADCRDWIDADQARRAHFAASGVVVPEAAPAAEVAAATFAEHNAASAAQDQTVVALLGPLEDWLRAHPDDETGHALRQRLLDHYAR